MLKSRKSLLPYVARKRIVGELPSHENFYFSSDFLDADKVTVQIYMRANLTRNREEQFLLLLILQSFSTHCYNSEFL